MTFETSTDLRAERRELLTACSLWKRKAVRLLVAHGLKRELRGLDKLSHEGSGIRAATSLAKVDPSACEELQRELFELDTRALDLTLREVRASLCKRFGPEIRVGLTDVAEYLKITSPLTNGDTGLPAFMSTRPPPLWIPDSTKGRPSADDEWAKTFPDLYMKFGARTSLENAYFAARTWVPAGAPKPTKRQVSRSWRRFMLAVDALESRRASLQLQAARIQIPGTRLSHRGCVGVEKALIRLALLGLTKFPSSIWVKAAAVEWFLRTSHQSPGF